MAHKKAGGSTRLGRDSQSKRLGVKIFGGQIAEAGSIIVRQRGQKYRGGENVLVSKDYTLHAAIKGVVKFDKEKKQLFTGQLKDAKMVSVVPYVEKSVVKAKKVVEPVADEAKSVQAPKKVSVKKPVVKK